MKKILLALTLLSGPLSYSQWTALNSTTSVQLNDVDFINENYGVIVGEAGTILRTMDGGLTWSDICNHGVSGDVFSVKVMNSDTIFVSTYDWSTPEGVIHRTMDGGTSWSIVGSDNTTNHKIDLELNEPANSLYASTSKLLRTDDYAASYDTLLDGLAGTVSADLLKFADAQTGHVTGNISGWITYSAYFFRTENGTNWYPGNAGSFPNSDASTTMAFYDADSAYVFMNQYAGFAPSAVNRLVRIANFNLAIPFPGDTSYTFNSSIVNPSMPDYINDARFEDKMNGLALGNTGKVYRTVDGGVNWTIDHNTGCGSCALLKMDFSNGTGYAVGASGTLIKYAVATGVADAEKGSFRVYPNPGANTINLSSDDALNAGTLSVYDLSGKCVKKISLNTFPASVNMEDVKAGSYLLEILSENGQRSHIKWIKL
jgi:photosystem II stability/assembly factor-like uncharacterized protein